MLHFIYAQLNLTKYVALKDDFEFKALSKIYGKDRLERRRMF